MDGGALSISRYFTDMLDPSMNWDDVAQMVREWGGPFCLKGIMSVDDARRAVEIGCSGIVLSITVGVSWMAPAAPSISWPRSSMRLATGSM